MAKPIPKRPKEVELTVVGLKYRVTTSSRVMLADHLPFPVKLEREPENREDENAIKVVAVKYFSHTFNDFHIGYLPRGVASVWAGPLDTGKLTIAEAWVTGIDVGAGTATMLVKARSGAKFMSTKPK
jgi:HIRAN domain